MIALETATEEQIAAELVRRIDEKGGDYLKVADGEYLSMHGTATDTWGHAGSKDLGASGPCVVLAIPCEKWL